MTNFPSSQRRLTVCGLSALALVLVCGASHSETAPPYPQLLKQALISAPRLAESQANIEAVRADAIQASAWRNPSLAIESENFNADRGGSAYDGRQTTYSINQPFELGGKRQARKQAAQAEVSFAIAEGQQAKVELVTELASAYADAEAAQARLVVYADDLQRAGDDLRVARALADAGREAPLRVAQAQAALSSADANFEAAKAEAASTLARLSALTGARDIYTAVAPSLLTDTGMISIPVINPANSPRLVAARAQRNARDAQVRVEQRRALPDLDVSIGVRQFPGQGERALIAGVSLPFPLFDRNKGGIAAAEARRNAADARVRSTEAVVSADQRSAVVQASASDVRLKASMDSRNYAADAYRLARIGYDAGKTPLLELLGTRRAYADAELTLINTRLDRARAIIALARTDGQLAFGE